MNDDLIELFKEVAGQKRAFPYNFTKMIIDAVPRIKPLWKDFISGTRKFQMDKLIRKHGRHFQMIEIQFLEFLHTTPFAAKEIFEIIHLQKYLDVNSLPEKYKYSEDEIGFMLNEQQIAEPRSDYKKAEADYFKTKG
jgi:hypothetical protein